MDHFWPTLCQDTPYSSRAYGSSVPVFCGTLHRAPWTPRPLCTTLSVLEFSVQFLCSGTVLFFPSAYVWFVDSLWTACGQPVDSLWTACRLTVDLLFADKPVGTQPCILCKQQVDGVTQSRLLPRSQAAQYGLREDEVPAGARVCTPCRCKAVRSRYVHCPLPSCPNAKGRVKRVRPFPAKWAELSAEQRDPIVAEFREYCLLHWDWDVDVEPPNPKTEGESHF